MKEKEKGKEPVYYRKKEKKHSLYFEKRKTKRNSYCNCDMCDRVLS